MSSGKSEQIWREIWKGPIDELRRWNYKYELSFSILAREIKSFDDKLCLEAGSGTGRLSLMLGRQGAKPVLLDTSKEAIKFSKRLAYSYGVDADFVIGSMFNLPFRDGRLDLIWNEGVLEHFEFQKQQLAVSEFLRVARTRGKVIVIVPQRSAWFYNLNRILSVKIGIWPFGYEEPLSREDFREFSLPPRALHSCGFLWQFTYFFVPKFSAVTNFFANRLHVSHGLHALSESNTEELYLGFSAKITLRLLRFLGLTPYLKKIDKYIPGVLIGAVWAKA